VGTLSSFHLIEEYRGEERENVGKAIFELELEILKCKFFF